MGLRTWIKPRIQDRVMHFMDEMRPEALQDVAGEVLEIGFGTGLNLEHYPSTVKSVTGLDPMVTVGVKAVDERIAKAPFVVERAALRADGELPFDEARFDSVVTTWTLCSIPDVDAALRQMRRVLKPGGSFYFIEHGRSPREATANWQDRLNPMWNKLADGCNLNLQIDELVEQSGFKLTQMNRFKGKGPKFLATMYCGTATKS